jgi:hypothetical protein
MSKPTTAALGLKASPVWTPTERELLSVFQRLAEPETGQIAGWSHGDLAAKVGRSTRTVIRAIGVLERAGS